MKNFISVVFVLALVMLAGCSGDGDSDGDGSDGQVDSSGDQAGGSGDVKIGYFLNTEGVAYTTSSGEEGKTAANGAFDYKSGDTVTFRVGLIELGTVEAEELITVFSFKEPELVSKTLHSLDADLNPYNGIKIMENTSSANQSAKSLLSNLKKLNSTSIGKTSSNQANGYISLERIAGNEKEYQNILNSTGVEVDANDVKDFDRDALFNFFFEEADRKSLRFYRHMLGSKNNAIDHFSSNNEQQGLINEAQENPENRIKSFVYLNDIRLIRDATLNKYAEIIENIDLEYKATDRYFKDKIDQAAEFILYVDTIQTSGFIKGVGGLGLSHWLNHTITRLEDIDSLLEDETLSFHTAATLQCVREGIVKKTLTVGKIKPDYLARAIGNCTVDELFSVGNSLNDRFLGDSAVMHATAGQLLNTGKNVGNVAISCAKSPDIVGCGVTTFRAVGKDLITITNAGRSTIRVLSNEKERRSQIAAFNLIQLELFLGSLDKVQEFLMPERGNDRTVDMCDLLEAALIWNGLHSGSIYCSTGEGKDQNNIAEMTYWEMEAKAIEYQSFYEKRYKNILTNENGVLQGVSSSFITSLKENVFQGNIDAVNVKTGVDNEIEILYSVNNSGHLPHFRFTSDKIAFKSKDGNVYELPHGISLHLDKYYKGKINIDVDKNPQISNILSADFTVDINLKYDYVYTSQQLRDLSGSLTLQGIFAKLEQERPSSIDIPEIHLEIERDTVDSRSFKAEVHLTGVVNSAGDVADYYCDWNHRASVDLSFDDLKSCSASVTLLSGYPSHSYIVKALVYKNDGEYIGIAYEKLKPLEQIPVTSKPLVVNSILASVKSGSKKILRAEISGGIPPYNVVWNVYDSKYLSFKRHKDEKSLVVTAIGNHEEKYQQQISYVVSDASGNSFNQKGTITFLPAETNLLSAKIRYVGEFPKSERNYPLKIKTGDVISKKWTLNNNNAFELHGVIARYDASLSNSSINHSKNDIVIGAVAPGQNLTVSVDISVDTSAEKKKDYYVVWKLFHLVGGNLLPLFYTSSKGQAYIYAFVDNTPAVDKNQPTISGGVAIQEIRDGFRLKWNKASNFGEYRLYRSTTNPSGSNNKGELVHVGAYNSYEDTDGLQSGLDYFYTVEAYHYNGNSAYSNTDFARYSGLNIADFSIFVTSISPDEITLGEKATFTIEGSNLPNSVSLAIDGMPCGRPFAVSSSSAKITCTASSLGSRLVYAAESYRGRKLNGSGTFSVLVNNPNQSGDVGDITKVIKNMSASKSTVEKYSSVDLSATIYNPSEVAYANNFEMAFVLSKDTSLGAGDYLLYRSGQGGFTLANSQEKFFFHKFKVSEDAPIGDYNLLACVIYQTSRASSQTSYCQSQALSITANSGDSSGGGSDGSSGDGSSQSNLSPPSKPTISYDYGDDEVRVYWFDTNDAEYFRLYRSTSANGNYQQINRTTGNKYFKDSNIQSGNTYFYKLKACNGYSEESCSSFSDYSSASVADEPNFDNDFYVSYLRVDALGDDKYSVAVNHAYSGNSSILNYVQLDIYISSDASCQENRLHLATDYSSLKSTDTSDGEEFEINLANFDIAGTWYICAISDPENNYQETSEDNNAKSLVIKTGVPAPEYALRRHLLNATVELRWQAVPGNVSYRLQQATSPDGPFSYVYIGTDLSYTTHNLDANTTYYYQLLSCNGTSSDSVCSSSAIIELTTLPNKSPEPILKETSYPGEIEVSWEHANSSATTYLVRKKYSMGVGGDFDEYVYFGSKKSFIDRNVGPNTTYQYFVLYLHNGDFEQRGYTSDWVSITTSDYKKENPDWVNYSLGIDVDGGVIKKFKNKLWLFDGYYDGDYNSARIYSSTDGISWTQETSATQLPKGIPLYRNIVSYNEKMYIFGFWYREDGSSTNINDHAIWSSSDGVTWAYEGEIPFTIQSNPTVVWNNKVLFVGSDDVRSFDGNNWKLETTNTPWNKLRYHTVANVGDSLFVYGGYYQDISYDNPERDNQKIWQSSDGINWHIVKNKAEFGRVTNPIVTEFNGDYYLVASYFRSPNYWERDSEDRFTELTISLNYGEIWKSKDGLHWQRDNNNQYLPVPVASGDILVTFKNQLIATNVRYNSIRILQDTKAVFPPHGLPLITGNPTGNQTLQVDLSQLGETRGIHEITYQWYANQEAVAYANASSYTVSDAIAVGSNIAVRVSYSNDNGDYQSLMSDSVTVAIQ